MAIFAFLIVCGIRLWLFDDNSKVPTLMATSCQKQFNDEFNIPIGTDLPVPISIFHKGKMLTLISAIQNYQNGKERPERIRNFSSEFINNASDWFKTNTWSIEYKLQNGHLQKANCKTIDKYEKLPGVVIVTCDIGSNFKK